jgi:hypothetical protein
LTHRAYSPIVLSVKTHNEIFDIVPATRLD